MRSDGWDSRRCHRWLTTDEMSIVTMITVRIPSGSARRRLLNARMNKIAAEQTIASNAAASSDANGPPE